MNVLSLFSGIGGLDLGLERAGMTVVGQVEIDPWCRTILAKRWPEVPRHDDVRTAAIWWGGRAVDLVCGGFPCQPVSLAGKGLAQADSRWLWPAFADIIRELRPQYALMENVPGLLGRGLGDVLGDLAELGYDAEWDCIPAAFVGAPHIRNRVFIVGYPQRSGCLGSDRCVGEHDAARRPERPAAIEAGITSETGSEPGVLADTDSGRRGAWRPGRPAVAGEARPGLAPQELAHAEGQRRGASRPDGQQARPDLVFGDAGQQCRAFTWPAEPDVGRVAHGIPRRVDRLRGLGNAVVPQVAEHIGRLILASELAVTS